ncbi:hypothetical protein ACWN8V_07125 [Vagococcus elongatus]|uniref:Uncharacterized protein n=1 Tax=Vagococcus elongatus TaxID=180344 RepID=A0A430AW70_9ENTE|nr:hypothetical protein [Vagococcus elongatus]RSU12303.1 hypothetical protein CBF29_06795 [Vagococcus elongatus]
MKLHELMATTEYYDGELILNGHNFWNECSFHFNQVKVSESALKEYDGVLNAEYIGKNKDGDIMLENKKLDSEQTATQGRKFLFAHSGYISDKLYQEYFPEME